MDAGEGGRLHRVMTSMARAIRLARSSGAYATVVVDPSLFQQAEEGALHDAANAVAAQVRFMSFIDMF